ncbi:MAG: metallophosphoesterase [Planctomycetes bacterium]|nr:metallophosphoesterase [Planctomycetota bacterium]
MVQYAFMLIGFLVTVLNLLLFLAVRRRLKLAFAKKGGLIAAIVAAPYWLLLHPSILMMFGGVSALMVLRNDAPQALLITSMTFQMAAWIYGGVLLIKGTPGAVMDGVRRLRRLLSSEKTGTEPEQELAIDERRRALAKAGLALPVAISATAAGGAVAARQTPVVTRLRLKVPREMTNLHGVTIAQVSDVHVGSYMGPERLDEFRDAMNALKADYHVMTGDLLDNHISQMEEAQRVLRGLSPKRQVFMCMGNHEYIVARDSDVGQIISGLRETGAQLLIDEAQKINVGGDHLWMGGIDYPTSRGIPGDRRTRRESLEHTIGQMSDDGAPRIVLAHHPASFYDGREMQLDLMLSGHTHGGQLVLGRIGDYTFSPVLPFDLYHNGHYDFEGRQLYVNRGAGGWMPVRINCPPEITLIELVSA